MGKWEIVGYTTELHGREKYWEQEIIRFEEQLFSTDDEAQAWMKKDVLFKRVLRSVANSKKHLSLVKH